MPNTGRVSRQCRMRSPKTDRPMDRAPVGGLRARTYAPQADPLILASVAPSPSGAEDRARRLCKTRSRGVDRKYGVVRITSYRFPVLGGNLPQRARETARPRQTGVFAKSINRPVNQSKSINRRHAPMVIAIPPQPPVSRAVQDLSEIDRLRSARGADISGVAGARWR